MANSYHNLNYHFIWRTRNREPWINESLETRLWEYIAGIAKQNRITPLCIGGHVDHIHALVRLPPNLDASKAIQLIKGPSSKWIHETFPRKRSFAWQDGYGAFSVSKSQIVEVFNYIKNQRQHHHMKTFKEEFIEFLQRHEIEYDEKYVWG